MSRAARKRARVVHLADIRRRGDADDSEAAALLSNLVSQCAEENATTSSSKVNPFWAQNERTDYGRSSSLLHFLRSENHTASGSGAHNDVNPPANQVSPPCHNVWF